MGHYGVKTGTGRSVLDEARDRISLALTYGDRPMVSFSGGKDSTVLLNLVLEVAAAERRLPVDVFFVDEEAIAPETEDYVRRVAARPDVNFLWSCVPVKHRNAASRRQPWWYTWNPADRERWVRPLPPEGQTAEAWPTVPWKSITEQVGVFYPPSGGTLVEFLGRRTSESLTRFKMIAQRRGGEAFMTLGASAEFRHRRRADPIYDFSTADVWTAIHMHGWDYNPAYDLMFAMGITPHQQRLAPPYGEEPLRQLPMWQICWPELWDRMQGRVDGAATALRYSRTALYSHADHRLLEPAAGESWEDYVVGIVARYPAADRAVVSHTLARALRLQDEHSGGRAMPDVEADPITGLSWRKLAAAASKGQLKNRSAQGKLLALRGKEKPVAKGH